MSAGGNLVSTKFGNILGSVFVAIVGSFMFRWALHPDMTFYVDDWAWLYRAQFLDWSYYQTIWTILPAAAYNDRPVGAMIIKLLYEIFGLNRTGFGVTLLGIHIANGLLLFILASKLLHSRFYGMVVAILFVTNIYVGYPAWWVGTIFDTTSFFFCMCAFLSFLSKKRYSWVLTILFYFLAVRSKEAALPFPFILVVYSFLKMNSSTAISAIINSLLHAVRSTWPVLLTFFLLLGLFIKNYIALKSAVSDLGPYTPKVDISTIAAGMMFYLREIGFELVRPEIAMISYLALTAVAFLSWNRTAVLGSLGFIIASAPALVLANQRVPYYGYIPSPYVALLFVALMQDLEKWLGSKLAMRWISKSMILLTIVLFTAYIYYKSMPFIESFQANMRLASRAMKALVSVVPSLENNTKVVITGVPSYPNLFSYAPCHAIMVMYKIPSIDCRIDGKMEDLVAIYDGLSAPKILLHYDAGDVSLRAKSP